MKRAGRWLLHLSSFVSLLLFLAASAAWVRSYWVRDSYRRYERILQANHFSNRTIQITTSVGGLGIVDVEWIYSNAARLPFTIPTQAAWEHGAPGKYPTYTLDTAFDATAHLLRTFKTKFLDFECLITLTSKDSPEINRLLLQHHQLLVTRLVSVPWRYIAIPTAILPAIWLFLLIHHFRRRLPGHCRKCNYDLRASTGRCPECGEPIANRPKP